MVGKLNRLVLIMLGLLFLISGCGELKSTFAYSDLLADKEGTYSLLVVIDHPEGKTLVEQPDVFRQFNEFNVLKASFIPKLKDAQSKYPLLEISNAPSFLVFDNKGLVLKTSNEKEVKSLLRK